MRRCSNSHNTDEADKIYISIDHLKKGQYELRVLLNNKIVKSVTIIK